MMVIWTLGPLSGSRKGAMLSRPEMNADGVKYNTYNFAKHLSPCIKGGKTSLGEATRTRFGVWLLSGFNKGPMLH